MNQKTEELSKKDHILVKLLSDESFLRWIRREADQQERIKWEAWEQQDTLHPKLKRQAQTMYDIPMDDKISSSIEDMEQELNQLHKRIDNASFTSRLRHSNNGYWKAAAAVILLLVGTISLLTFRLGGFENPFKPDFKTIRAGYGETTSIKISDGSLIRLNANSTLRYKAGQLGSDKMEVWLRGEGYFSITHNPHGQKRTFIVHTQDGDITDLGTRFNVNTHFRHTNVVLEKGKVALSLIDSLHHVKTKANMKPGQRAILDPSLDKITEQNVNTSLYTAWLDGKLKFHETSLQEIIRKIKNTYGISISVADSSLLSHKVSGSLKNPNFKTLVKGLESSLNITFKKVSEDRFSISIQR